MTDWQPIETAPRDGTHLLLWEDGQVFVGWFKKKVFFDGPRYKAEETVSISMWWSAHHDIWAGEYFSMEPDSYIKYAPKPTHWQPLPEPPHA